MMALSGAQFVGHVGDEFGFEPVGGFQRGVAFAQRALDPRAVGDVEIGVEAAAVGQRQ
jgi:hypothetical protein